MKINVSKKALLIGTVATVVLATSAVLGIKITKNKDK